MTVPSNTESAAAPPPEGYNTFIPPSITTPDRVETRLDQNIYLEVDDGVQAFLARTPSDAQAIEEEDVT